MTKIDPVIIQHPVSRIRRNHAMEHATLHLLAARKPGLRMAGISDVSGFRIIGNVSTQDIQQAADGALARLNNGEAKLAYHPNCGTNFVTAGIVAGLTAWTGMLGCEKSFRSKASRLPLVILMVTAVMVITRPLGPFIQRTFTIDPVPGTLQVVEIRRHDFGSFVLHRVITKE